MKKSIKRPLMGLVLICVAVMMIANQVGVNLFPDGLSGARIAFLAISALVLVDGVLERNIWSIGLGAGFGYWILQKPCGWPELSIWVLLMTWILVCTGLEMIFHKKKHVHVKIDRDDWDEVKEEGVFDSSERCYEEGHGTSSVFSSSTRYVQDTDYRGGKMEVVFSSMQLYLDQAKLHNGRAVLNVDVVFSSLIIYVPKEWTVVNNTGRVMSRRSDDGFAGNGEQTLIVEGDCVFGNIQFERV
jgi:hypothetical protein